MKVLIIGGGVAGPALALALKRSGHDVELFDRVVPPSRAPGSNWVPADIGGAILLNENVLRVLKHLGVLNEALAAGTQIARHEISYMDGRAFAVYPTHDKGEFVSTGILRCALARIVNRALNSYGVYMKVNKKLAWIEQPSNGSLGVTAFFEDGSKAYGDILVGADGINSTVRSILFPDILANKSRYSGYFAMSPIPAKPLPPVFTTMVDGQTGNYGFVLPAGNTMVHWGIFESRSETNVNDSWDVAGDVMVERDRILGITAKWGVNSDFRDLVRSATRVIRVKFTSVAPLSQWHKQNCVLIGDAAHGMLPFISQGAGMSLEDSLVLSVLLDRLPRQPRLAFEYLHEIRAARVQKVAAQSEALGQRSGSSAFTAAIGFGFLRLYSYVARVFGLSLFSNEIIRYDSLNAAMKFLASKGPVAS
ncbi:hypothetical protein HK405_010081 [Cladochytrium tenue]|nr:hypothetical protein HK405_010081 [Cladochytrium tenue]